jgi:hypothetical protein
MPNLIEATPSDLDWKFDFSPQIPWASILPVLGVVHQNTLTVVAGFDRKNVERISVLEVSGPLEYVMKDLYPTESLRPLELLRFEMLFGRIPEDLKFLVTLPLQLQIFLDQRQVSLKALMPFQYLNEWVLEITKHFLSLRPSSSQIRELLDLLCDLKMNNRSWNECEPKSAENQNWVSDLFKLRNPNLNHSDMCSSKLLQKANWPKGVRARWERQGDQGAINIQMKAYNSREFENFKNAISKVEIEEELWNH